MCGRFVRKSPISDIIKEFHVEGIRIKMKPSYNVAPSQNILIVINEDGRHRMKRCRWGFVPSWAKDPSIGYKMINARGETVAEKPSFKKAFKNQRCLIVADGFYEWYKRGKKKVPLYIRMKSKRSFSMAGLYNLWTSPEGESLWTCTIITTSSNDLLKPLHERMPVIIPEDKRELWLDPDVQEKEILLSLLGPYPSEKMELYEVSSEVNSPSNNSITNIRSLNTKS